MNEKAMNCMSSNPAEMHKIFGNIQTEPVYQVVKGKSLGTVHFELEIPDLDLQKEADTLIFIESAKAGSMIFAGPLRPKFSVEFDERLTANGPGDNIEFRLFRFKQNQICVQAQQKGEAYWQSGATVNVKFLREPYLHETVGIPISFEVKIAKP